MPFIRLTAGPSSDLLQAGTKPDRKFHITNVAYILTSAHRKPMVICSFKVNQKM